MQSEIQEWNAEKAESETHEHGGCINRTLRDWIYEKGCKASISETIKVRTNGLVSKGEEIIQVSETPMKGGNGISLAAIKLYEAQVIPA